MRAHAAAGAIRLRTGRPFTWGAVLVFGLMWNGARWILLPHGLDLDGEALAPFAWGFVLLVLSPLPWQWTGDERPLASPLRGLAQALVFGFLVTWLLVEALGTGGLAGGRGPGMMGPRGMHGRGMHGGMGMPPARRTLLAAGVSFSFLVLLGSILARLERAEAEEAKAREAAGRARLRTLQAQLHPHFLFNAVSGVAELVREDPSRAERALLDMAGLLRQVLDLGERTAHPLGEERRLAERYLALEALRLDRRLRVAWDWDGNLDTRPVPPLLLQPLVENAIKHGIAPEHGGGELRIRAAEVEGRLELEVANTGRPLAAEAADGVGLGNLRARLALLGPGSAFTLVREGDWTRATLRLPLEARHG